MMKPIYKYLDKKVRIIDTNHDEYIGVVEDYMYAEDNNPEKESLIVNSRHQLVEFFEEDIVEIEVLD